MLQIDHVYDFFYNVVFNKNFEVWSLPNGVPALGPIQSDYDYIIFKPEIPPTKKIFFYDQEPLLPSTTEKYINHYQHFQKYTLEELRKEYEMTDEFFQHYLENPNRAYKLPGCLCVSEHSEYVDQLIQTYKMKKLYYFFHGFAALDWYRGYYALNYTKNPVQKYQFDYQSFNRIVTGDRAYRKTFVDQLRANNLLEHGAVSYGVTDEPVTEQRLVIDHEQLPGSASADIPDVDAFWHVVTETVFYYDKLHLTEKIFKPIVSKQPFMLLAAPGNLEYLRSYGFKTFDGIIDESYDHIQDNDQRIDNVVKQINWYCNLSDSDKFEIQRLIAPIVEYNFHHFYGEFKNIIVDELLTNCKNLFEEIDYKETVDYETIRKLLLN